MLEYWEARNPSSRVLVAVAAVACAVLLRFALMGLLGPRTPFLTFYPAVMIAALCGGAISGFTSTGLLALLAYFWVLPQGQPPQLDTASWLAIGMFLFSGTVLSLISEGLRRARRRTARAEAEAALAAQGCELNSTIRRLAAIVESSDDAIVGLSPAGIITSWNEGARRLYGYAAEETVGRHASMLCLPACTDEVDVLVGKIADGQRVKSFETKRRHKSGAELSVSMSLSAIRGEDGQPTGMAAVVRDVSERQRMEQALRESQRQATLLADLLEASSQPFGVGYPDGRLGMCNSAYSTLLGYTRQEFAALDWTKDITPPEWLPQEFERLAELKRTGVPIRYEKEYLHKNGQRVPVELLVNLRQAVDGQPEYYSAFVTDISGRKRAEAALRASEAFSRTIIESSPDCIKMLSREGELIFMNQGGARLLEIDDTSGIIGQSYLDMWQGTARQRAQAALETARQGSVGRFDGYFPTAKGMPKWWDVTITPLYDQKAEVDRYLVISRDETQRRQAEQALRNEKERLATIIDTSPELMFLKDINLRYLAANAAHELLLGLHPQDMLGRTDAELMDPDLAESCRATDLAALRKGVVQQEEQVGERWFSVRKKRVEGADGQPLGVSALISDITESRRAYEALRESEERFRQLVENAPEAIFVQTRGRFTYVNQACVRLYGAEATGQILGQTIISRVDPAYHSQVVERIRKLNETGQAVPGTEMRHLRLDGQVVEVEVSAVPLVYGGERGALVFLRDIGERKRVETLREDIERIARHDLKTPLNAVINLPLLLMADHNLDPEQMTSLQMIHEAGLRMLEQIDQSLTLYRIETGSFVLAPQAVDLSALVRQVAGDLGSLARALNVALLVEAGLRPVTARGDALLCRTMISNLLKNAVEASAQGEVTVCLREEQGQAVLGIHNDGAVPLELRARFFEKYASRGKAQGAGLGTYSARLSAEAQKGGITLDTGEEQGTTVTVRLPLWKRPD